MSEPNPYAAPSVETAVAVERVGGKTDRTVIWAWEWLRLYYNAALTATAIIATLLFAPSELLTQGYWRDAIFAAIGANICFCLGPIVETYLVWFGMPEKVARWLVFVLGLAGSMLVTTMAVLVLSIRTLPNQN